MKHRIVWYSVVLGALAGAVKADNLAFFEDELLNNFGTVDLNTGLSTVLGNSGKELAGMAEENGTLYGVDMESPGTSNLYSVNPANGDLTVIGSSAVEYVDFGGTTGGGLFAVGLDLDLYSIDPATGAATLIGPTGLSPAGFRGLSNNSGTLFLWAGGGVYTINTKTGLATLLGTDIGAPILGMVMEGGSLFGVDPFGVESINPTNGTVSPVTGSSDLFVAVAPDPIVPGTVPEPGTVLLTGTVIGALALRKRRGHAGA